MDTGLYKQIGGDLPPSYNISVDPKPLNLVQSSEFGQMTSTEPAQQAYTTIFSGSAIPPLGPRPCVVTCPSCQEKQTSKVRYEVTTKTHLIAALLCAFGMCCVACIPYCMDTCKNPNHYCKNCDTYLGTYTA